MSLDFVIDAGTANTVLFADGKIVLDEPSVVTVDTATWEPLHFGKKAKEMVGRTPESMTTVFPIERGVIADYDVAESMIKYFMKKAFNNKIIKPRVVIAAPSGVTAVQHHSIAGAVIAAGGRNVITIESPMAAALGMGVDFSKPHGSLIVDIGAGTTDIAAISMGGISECDSVRIASQDFDDAIMKYVRKEYNILIGHITAENIKLQVGSVQNRQFEITMRGKGRNQFTGLPEAFEITSNEVCTALAEVAYSICRAVASVIEKTQPDILADVMSDGIYLTGGGAQIFGMAELMSEQLSAPVRLVENPSHSVVRGAAKVLKNPSLLKNSDFQFRAMQNLIVEQQ